MAESAAKDNVDKGDAITDAQALIGVIEDYEKDFKKWQDRSDKIVKRYRDEREITPGMCERFNILWSNVQTATPLLFSQVPKPIVERRYEKGAPVARVASQILEGTLKTNMDDCDFEAILRQSVEDYQLAGRGQLWACYEPEFANEKIQPASEQVQQVGADYVGADSNKPYDKKLVTQGADGLFYGQGEAFAPLEYERVFPLYIHYKDFGHNVARYWSEVWITWRKVYFSKRELTDKFGKEIANKIPLVKRYIGTNGEASKSSAKKAEVFEMWDSTDKKVKYIHKDIPEQILLTLDDPLKLDKFFPCPKPLYATTTNDQLVPVPDYLQYQDQANELDELTERISKLVKALKVVGVYAGDQKSTVQKMLGAGTENKLIPVEDWLTLQGSGGLAKVIEWLPIDMVAQALMELYDARDKVKQVIYEITGFADVMRGATDPRETLGAQQLKGKFGTLRISDRQKAVARFARDIIDIMGQIAAQQFDPKTLALASGIFPVQQPPQQPPMAPPPPAMPPQGAPGMPGMPPQGAPPPMAPPPPQPAAIPDGAYFEEAIKLLKSNLMRHFTIDIEADSTIMPDLEAEKQATTEFLTSIGGFLESSMPVVQQAPQLAPLIGQMLLMGVRKFHAGRSLESAVESFVQELEEQSQNAAANPQPKPPSPEELEQQAQAADMQQKQKLAADQQLFEQQREQADAAAEHERAMAEIASNERIAMAKVQSEGELEKMKLIDQFNLKKHEIDSRASNDLEGKRMTAAIAEKPAANISIDGQDTLDELAENIQTMAETLSQHNEVQSAALVEAVQGMTAAVQAMVANISSPRSITTPSGATYKATIDVDAAK